MKNYIFIIVLLLFVANSKAQEYLKIELNKGTYKEYSVSDMKKIFFKSAKPSSPEELMKIEFNNGSVIDYLINDIKQYYFYGDAIITPSEINLKYGDKYQLSAPYATAWSTNNDFVATVDNNGLVTGGHLGTTKITATNSNSSSSCDVTITAKYTLFDDPIFNWGASMNSIMNEETHSLHNSSATSLLYSYDLVGNVNDCAMLYEFENDQLYAIFATFVYNSSLYNKAKNHIKERYQYIDKIDGSDTYIDAMALENAHLAVTMDIYNLYGTNVIRIGYMPYDGSIYVPRRSGTIGDIISNVKSQMGETMKIIAK